MGRYTGSIFRMNTLAEKMRGRLLILASSSPRRHHLIAGLDIPFRIEISDQHHEKHDSSMHHSEVPEFLAKQKAKSFSRQLKPGEILLTADTLVIHNQNILGKPQNRDEAIKMLETLSDSVHTVITGVSFTSERGSHSFSVSTNVYFKELNRQEIEFYIDKYKPYDKAGAYGAQEWLGFIAIKKIEGSYFNVMGLPVQWVYSELCKFIEAGN